ncbi:class I SAM-dependent methyltransferase [Dactylosporangium sp. AC04546]|uniref:class I SAM-dependent methyltransferase n=1 Tax=Dactylosporangium sp. AC04546 TaxID=2862460 RepID=UPI001EDCBD6B|nr:class I SAM-dependent methyltransferase [Dactylosporangium sp. AC04546]WVK80952.1 class I SAM-dependent methyltransferase [Dactylosporangium sp. AC04546]
MTFDAVAYKTTTRQQWEDAAEAWHRWGPTLEQWLGAATAAMLDAAGVGRGSRVLDVAGGAGGQSMTAARRTGPEGGVVVTDISPTILSYAQRAADESGLRQVTTYEVDGEEIGSRWSGEFDAAISRLGLIYFPDRARALRGIRSSLREGGRFAAIVYSTADRNAFFSVPVALIRSRAGLAAPLPGQPGPFSLGEPASARDALRDAGFRDVRVETMDAPLLLPSAADCVRFERESFGALHQMLSGVEQDERERIWADIESALQQYETGAGFVGPCELHVISGSR